ncbi:MAG TPA: winged helix-turn-helix domain-containing protein [Thermoplasmata archaeon]|nr:winged helix-turn-helix domain-containing protein [Thermoplasmata archaeon]
MRSYRTEIAILLEILRAMDAGEVTLARLSHTVNVPYRRLEEYADELCRRKLAEEVPGDEGSDRATRFRVTDEGRKFMTEARQFEWFLHSYGIQL